MPVEGDQLCLATVTAAGIFAAAPQHTPLPSVHATDRQSPDIPRNAGPIQLAAPPQNECISRSRIVPRPSASRRAATTREPSLSNHEELRFDEGSTQRAHWAGPSRAAHGAAPTKDRLADLHSS
eukprot:scaffold61292_cov64-Phaeocystis_antarctica.AAC.4